MFRPEFSDVRTTLAVDTKGSAAGFAVRRSRLSVSPQMGDLRGAGRMAKRESGSDARRASRSPGRKLGIPARDLGDGDLERELRHLWRTREDAILNGAANAIRAHTDRMLELEHEYIARFPRKTKPSAGRTRRGARARSGQRRGRQEKARPAAATRRATRRRRST